MVYIPYTVKWKCIKLSNFSLNVHILNFQIPVPFFWFFFWTWTISTPLPPPHHLKYFTLCTPMIKLLLFLFIFTLNVGLCIKFFSSPLGECNLCNIHLLLNLSYSMLLHMFAFVSGWCQDACSSTMHHIQCWEHANKKGIHSPFC